MVEPEPAHLITGRLSSVSRFPLPSSLLQPPTYSLFLGVQLIYLFIFKIEKLLKFVAHGILVLQPGIKPMPPVKARSINHWTAREAKLNIFRFHIKLGLCSICLSLSDLLHLA